MVSRNKRSPSCTQGHQEEAIRYNRTCAHTDILARIRNVFVLLYICMTSNSSFTPLQLFTSSKNLKQMLKWLTIQIIHNLSFGTSRSRLLYNGYITWTVQSLIFGPVSLGPVILFLSLILTLLTFRLRLSLFCSLLLITSVLLLF